MTKEEVRTITISKLRLQEDHTVVDIGAGTGSLSIEAALVCKRGRVISIERKEEGIDLIKKNMEKFHINNLIPINGKAIEALNDIDFFHRAIIGGSGGQLEEIVRMCHEKLVDGGILVVNAITIETLYNSIKFMEKEGFEKIETICVNISRGDKLGNYTLMKGLNPIYIITGRK
ncbi:MAG: precorrin-6Y C5,15-methyltransferase (decarboxylating) subunit CbiT [Anaeromicrobium sp.]|uniref:precorrin-6Y C5,15-methyltransferase (decarboxylating) subunit CbiT n=1 Tax=Anaeromicrobium sp. TaxID=1929132 RepID=UPI0025E4AAC8|nr:precorrin-6Y C5,15-methyltransferase (decarboxylating) subunit CbiT [Anaeromicrobium sp.]MCT4593027.1 precorrin-6Y C5,15-methyltransferase (decarboxylating) subunit CbiT [Anaeromicrobium sp.]